MKKIFIFILSLAIFFVSATSVSASRYALFCDLNDNPTSNQTNRLYTAIGCFPIGDAQSSLIFIFRWALGIGSGVAFLLIILASFQITSSSGNPEKIQAGKELLTSAIAGLIMLIFSYYILKVIGVDLFKLPMSM